MNGPVTPEDLHTQNEALRLENERLTRALEQVTELVEAQLGIGSGLAGYDLTDDTVLICLNGHMAPFEMPELALWLRAREAQG